MAGRVLFAYTEHHHHPLCVRVLSRLTPRESRRLHLIITDWRHSWWKSTQREARWADCAKRMITVVFISISVKLYPPWFFFFLLSSTCPPLLPPSFFKTTPLFLSALTAGPVIGDVLTVSSLCAPRPDYSRSSQMQHIYTLYIRGGKTRIAQIEVQMKGRPMCP